jgi:peptidyl-prolyl cis-trans isomerase SurA
MRTTRLHHLKLAAALLCALTANAALARPKKPAAARTPAQPRQPPPPPRREAVSCRRHRAAPTSSIRSVVVNDEVITRNEVRGRVAQIVQRLRAQNAQLPAPADLSAR